MVVFELVRALNLSRCGRLDWVTSMQAGLVVTRSNIDSFIEHKKPQRLSQLDHKSGVSHAHFIHAILLIATAILHSTDVSSSRSVVAYRSYESSLGPQRCCCILVVHWIVADADGLVSRHAFVVMWLLLSLPRICPPFFLWLHPFAIAPLFRSQMPNLTPKLKSYRSTDRPASCT